MTDRTHSPAAEPIFMCPICIEPIDQQVVGLANLVRYSRRHFLHEQCFWSAVAVDSRCPTCRLEWSSNPPLLRGLELQIDVRRPIPVHDPRTFTEDVMDWEIADAESSDDSEHGTNQAPTLISVAVSVSAPARSRSPQRVNGRNFSSSSNYVNQLWSGRRSLFDSSLDLSSQTPRSSRNASSKFW